MSVSQTNRSKEKVPILESRKGGEVVSKNNVGGVIVVVTSGCTEMKVGEDTGVPLPESLTLATEYSS